MTTTSTATTVVNLNNYTSTPDNPVPTIIIDSREYKTAPKVTQALTQKGASLQHSYLTKGDYIISDTCAVERKTVGDFIFTLTGGRLFTQLHELREAYPNTILLIEGYLPAALKYSKITPQAVWGAQYAITKQGIPIINTPTPKDTADFLYTAAKQEQTNTKKAPAIHNKKPAETLQDQQLYLIAALPGVGAEKATKILQTYQTPLNALKQAPDWINTIHGIGPHTTAKIDQILNLTAILPNKYTPNQEQTL